MILPSRSEFDFIKKPLSFLIVHYKQNKEEKGRGFERYEIIFSKIAPGSGTTGISEQGNIAFQYAVNVFGFLIAVHLGSRLE